MEQFKLTPIVGIPEVGKFYLFHISEIIPGTRYVVRVSTVHDEYRFHYKKVFLQGQLLEIVPEIPQSDHKGFLGMTYIDQSYVPAQYRMAIEGESAPSIHTIQRDQIDYEVLYPKKKGAGTVPVQAPHEEASHQRKDLNIGEALGQLVVKLVKEGLLTLE